MFIRQYASFCPLTLHCTRTLPCTPTTPSQSSSAALVALGHATLWPPRRRWRPRGPTKTPAMQERTAAAPPRPSRPSRGRPRPAGGSATSTPTTRRSGSEAATRRWCGRPQPRPRFVSDNILRACPVQVDCYYMYQLVLIDDDDHHSIHALSLFHPLPPSETSNRTEAVHGGAARPTASSSRDSRSGPTAPRRNRRPRG